MKIISIRWSNIHIRGGPGGKAGKGWPRPRGSGGPKGHSNVEDATRVGLNEVTGCWAGA